VLEVRVELKAAGNQKVVFEFEPKGIGVQIYFFVVEENIEKRIVRSVSQKELKALLKSL